MAVTLPVPVGVRSASGLNWTDFGVGPNPARISARLAASGSGTKCPTWSRNISSPVGNWRLTSTHSNCIAGRPLPDPDHSDVASARLWCRRCIDLSRGSEGTGMRRVRPYLQDRTLGMGDSNEDEH